MPYREPFDLALVEYYRDLPDWKRYRAWVEQGARAGDSLAIYAVATWYLDGNEDLGIKANPRRGADWLEKAAALFMNRAIFDLAVCYETGEGRRANHRKAVSLYRSAAKLGCIAGYDELARCYREGIGVKKNVRQAKKMAAVFERLSQVSYGPRTGTSH